MQIDDDATERHCVTLSIAKYHAFILFSLQIFHDAQYRIHQNTTPKALCPIFTSKYFRVS